eukprot:10999700-Alexandrium_andersonii.AAC.1
MAGGRKLAKIHHPSRPPPCGRRGAARPTDDPTGGSLFGLEPKATGEKQAQARAQANARMRQCIMSKCTQAQTTGKTRRTTMVAWW